METASFLFRLRDPGIVLVPLPNLLSSPGTQGNTGQGASILDDFKINLLLDIAESLGHLPVLCLRHEDGDGPGDDGHGSEDDGGYGGVYVGQGGHGGGEGPPHLGHQGGGAHSSGSDGGRHQLSYRESSMILDSF